MRQAIALLDLALVAVALTGSLAGRSRAWGWLLLLASGAWLPVNNGVLEGPVLLVVTGKHGLTVSDLLGVAGVLLGGLRVWPPHTWRPGRWLALRAAVLAAVVIVGFVAALVATDIRVDERFTHEERTPHVRVHLAAGNPSAPRLTRGWEMLARWDSPGPLLRGWCAAPGSGPPVPRSTRQRAAAGPTTSPSCSAPRPTRA